MVIDNDISVVVQGAVIKKLTIKCLKSIRKYLPNAEIILSTWENSDVKGLDYDVLLLNQDPGGIRCDWTNYNKNCFMNNFNRQLVSTQNGVKKASRKYILKLRTDLELTNAEFLNYWDEFSCRNEQYKVFNHRVLCSSFYSRENSCQIGTGYPTPFHPSDFWFFGEAEDLKNYFLNTPLQTKEEGGLWNYKFPNRLPYSSMLWRYAPEQQFCLNWIKKYYPNLKFDDWSDWNAENIEFSNNILYNNFIFLDYEQSGIYSKKHSLAIKNKNEIQGLITFQNFKQRYKELCDSSYPVIKTKGNYQTKLQKHFNKLMLPFHKFMVWFGEIFSILYYAFAMFLVSLDLGKKNDKH